MVDHLEQSDLVSIERWSWAPQTFDEAVTDLKAGRVRESHYFEAKSQIPAAKQGASMTAKALCGLSNDSGVFAIGLDEDQNGMVTQPSPVPLQGLRERVLNVAAECDPRISLPPMNVLEDPNNPGNGILIVYVPASLNAPHMAPDDRYYGRDDARSYPLTDAEIQRLMARRASVGDRIIGVLDEWADRAWREVGSGAAAPWLAIAMEPVPDAPPRMLLDAFDDQYVTTVQSWLASAEQGPQRVVELAPDLGEKLGATPFHGQGGEWRRTSTGVAARWRASWGTAIESRVLEIDRNGAIRLAANWIGGVAPAAEGFQWRAMIGSVAGAIELFRQAQRHVGRESDFAIGVRIGGIGGQEPVGPFLDERKNRDAMHAGMRLVPYQAAVYSTSLGVNAADAGGDLRQVFDLLFAELFNSMGLPRMFGQP